MDSFTPTSFELFFSELSEEQIALAIDASTNSHMSQADLPTIDFDTPAYGYGNFCTIA
jgi:hypothetical protein